MRNLLTNHPNRRWNFLLQIGLRLASKPSKPPLTTNWVSIRNVLAICVHAVQAAYWIVCCKFVRNWPPNRPSIPNHRFDFRLRMWLQLCPKPSNGFSVAHMFAICLQAVLAIQIVQAVHWIFYCQCVCNLLPSRPSHPSRVGNPRRPIDFLWEICLQLAPKPSKPSKPSIGYSIANLLAICFQTVNAVQTVYWMLGCKCVDNWPPKTSTTPPKPCNVLSILKLLTIGPQAVQTVWWFVLS